MHALIQKIEEKYRKPKIVDVRSGDTVRVHQRIQEGGKTRTQIFEGLVIRTRRMGSLNASMLVRRITSGVGVEKGYLLHSPNIEKIEITRRAKVRRNYLSYMRQRGGKSARLSGVDFDRGKANEAVERAEPEVPEDTSKTAKEAEKALTEEAKPEPKAEELMKETKPEEKAAKAEETQTREPVETAEKEEPARESKDETKSEDKAQAKKAKAEAFRQSQADKKK